MPTNGMLLSDLRAFLSTAGAARIETFVPAPGREAVPVAGLPTVRCVLEPDIELLVCWGEQYPVSPPFIMVTSADRPPAAMPLRWNLSLPPADRLAASLTEFIHPPGPYRVMFGEHHTRAITEDPEEARRLGLLPYLLGQALSSPERTAPLFARSSRLVDDSLLNKRVALFGLGSGGSYVANALCRAGVGRFVLVDPDIVEAANLSRTTYEVLDIGAGKARALEAQLRRINPCVIVETFSCAVQDFEARDLFRVIQESDLVLALTDDPQAQSVINRLAYGAKRPAVFASLYAGARGGEVLLLVSGLTPCYACSTGYRRETLDEALPSVERSMDYGTTRLAGEAALGCDIQHLDSVTVKCVLGLLLVDGDVAVARFVQGALAKGFTFMVLGMSPDFYLFPHLFRYGQPDEVQGQYAYQSAWLSPTSRPDCPICGSHQLDPLATPISRGPRL